MDKLLFSDRLVNYVRPMRDSHNLIINTKYHLINNFKSTLHQAFQDSNDNNWESWTMNESWSNNASSGFNIMFLGSPGNTVFGVYSVILKVVLLLAILGNILVILTISSQRRLKTNYHFFVLHLALCDLTISLTYFTEQMLPTNFLFDLTNYVILKNCHGVATSAEYLILLAIAILRYRAVAKPFATGVRRKKLFFSVGLIYSSSLVISTVVFLLYFTLATHTFKVVTRISLYGLLLGSIATVLLMIVLYGKTCYLLYIHNNRMKNIHNEENNAKVCHLAARQKEIAS